YHQRIAVRLQHGTLAIQLGGAVFVDRPGWVVLAVRAGQLPVEHEVGGQVDQPRAVKGGGRSDVCGAVDVHLAHPVASLEVGGVHHGGRSDARHQVVDGGTVAHVEGHVGGRVREVRAGRSTTGVPSLRQQLTAQIATRAGHQDARLRARVRRLHAPIVATLDVRAAPQRFTETAMTTTLPGQDTDALLTRLGLDPSLLRGGDLEVRTPITGAVIVKLHATSAADAEAAIVRSVEAFQVWRDVPAPRRGELVRLLADELRQEKEALVALVTLEAGKIGQEGLGEVQEMIDICDFAVGLSRQLYGLTIASERPGHRMMETWHPLGPVGVITAFNFPVAVWSWNSALAFVCGDPVLWKPSSRTPLTALACEALFRRAVQRFGDAPAALSQVVQGARETGEA